MSERADLLDLTRDETRAWIASLGEQPFRGDQLFRWAHGRGVADVAAMTDLGKALRGRLAGLVEPRPLAVDLAQLSSDGTRKLRLRTSDGRAIEMVMIPEAGPGDAPATSDEPAGDEGDEEGEEEPAAPGPRPRRPKLTLCVSSQVGCALDCAFCATAALGLGRNLRGGEIAGQVYVARALLAALPDDDPTRRAGAGHVTNVVLMGMGEPLHNLDEVLRALAMLTDGHGMDLSSRRITLSTAGLVPGIARLGAVPPSLRPNLALSLNATTDEVRDRLMPINRRWPIAALLDAARAYPLERRRRLTFEYVLLDGVNDTDDDARRLPRLLRGLPCKVNLIPWNGHAAGSFRRPDEPRVARFQALLRDAGLAAYLRRPRGRDIDAACGQLAARPAAGLAPRR